VSMIEPKEFAGGLGCAAGDGSTTKTEEIIIGVCVCIMPIIIVVWVLYLGIFLV
jgi:hypothetical protein